MKPEIRRAEFVVELLALHAEACKLGLAATSRSLSDAALNAVREMTDKTEAAARAKRNTKG